MKNKTGSFLSFKKPWSLLLCIMGGIVYGMLFNGSVIKPFVGFLTQHQEGDKVPIPTECPEDTHPLKVFEDTHVERNISQK